VSDIKTGDLVQVIRPVRCCGDSTHLGEIFSVLSLSTKRMLCNACLKPADITIACSTSDNSMGFAIYTLKRLPPLDELERDQIVKEFSI
jgi:hypothetical protein